MVPTTITKTYKEIGTNDFAMIMHKIDSTPTDNINACAINKITKIYRKAKEQIHKEFKDEILQKYAQKKEDGTLDSNAREGFIIPKEVQDEYDKAVNDFEGRVVEFAVNPLRPQNIKDVKITPREIDALGDLFTEEGGPGVPGGASQATDNVRSLHN